MVYTKKMLVKDWITVEDNPIQRDTERHAARAKHLLIPHPTHSIVYAAELPSGKLIKLDGHTRALLWERKQVEAPMQVTVCVLPAKDRAEAEKLYKDFDSREALETNRDKVSGAFNRHHFEPSSPLLQYGSITYAMKIAWSVLKGNSAAAGAAGVTGLVVSAKVKAANSVDIYTIIDEFSPELHALDGYMLRQGQLTAGTMAAFILSFRRHGHKIIPFWTGVFGGKGTKMQGQMDGIQAVLELTMIKKGQYGGSASTDMCARILAIVEKWLKDELLYRQPPSLDTIGYLTGHEKPTERLIKKADMERARIQREEKEAARA